MRMRGTSTARGGSATGMIWDNWERRGYPKQEQCNDLPTPGLGLHGLPTIGAALAPRLKSLFNVLPSFLALSHTIRSTPHQGPLLPSSNSLLFSTLLQAGLLDNNKETLKKPCNTAATIRRTRPLRRRETGAQKPRWGTEPAPLPTLIILLPFIPRRAHHPCIILALSPAEPSHHLLDPAT